MQPTTLRLLTIPLVTALALLAGGCGGDDPEASPEAVADLGVSPTEAGCDEVRTEKVETPPDDGDGLPAFHEPQGLAVEYATAPPAYGLHWPTFLTSDLRPFFTRKDTPEVETLVHSLEHGHTIAWYDDSVTEDSAAYAALEAIAEGLPREDYLIAAPWTGAAFPGGKHLALTHWTGPEDMHGVWRYCADVSGAVVEEFVADYPATNSPEPGAP